jgi:hypothetical protein
MALLTKDFIVKSGLVVQGTTTPITTSTENTGALQVNGGAAFAKDILIGSSATIYGPSVLQSTLNVAGNVNVNSGNFTVAAASGNTHVNGNMGVRGTFNSTGTLSVNTDKFTVDATNGHVHAEGNMGVRGTFNSTGTLTVNTDKFTVDASSGNTHAEGNMGVRGTFNSTGTLSVNTNKFTVDAGSGNTNAAGDFSVDNTKFTVNSSTGNTSVLGTLHSGGNFDVATDKFTVTSSNGNVHAEGNMGVRGTFNSTGTLSVNTDKFTVTASNGNVYADGNMGVRGTFNSTGTLSVNTDKFTVDSASGNTHAEGNMGVRGTFNSTGTLTVNDNFTVTASNGNVETDGTLKVNNTGSDLTTAASNSLYTLGGAHIAKDLKVGQDVVIVGKLTVQGVQTIVDSTVTNISDPVIELGTGPNSAALAVDDGLNRGIALHYYNTATSADNQMFIGRDSTGHIIVKTNAAGNTNADVAAAAYATMEIGSILGKDTTASTSTTDTNALDLAGGFSVRGASYIDDDLKVTGTIHGTVTQANNLNGGGTGSIPYQTAAGVTAFIPIGGSNTVLTSNGTTATWASASATVVGRATTATNVDGPQWSVLYQKDVGLTTATSNLQYNASNYTFKVDSVTLYTTTSTSNPSGVNGNNTFAVPAGQNIELYSSTAAVSGTSQLNHDGEIFVKAGETGASLEVVGATFTLNTLTNAVLSGSGYLQAPHVRPQNLTSGRVVLSDGNHELTDDGGLTYDSGTDKLTVGGSIEVSGGGGNLTMTGGDFTGAANISLTGSDGGTSTGGALKVTNGGIFSKKEVYIDSGNDYNDAHPALHIPNGGIMVGDSIGIGTHLTMTNATSTIWFKDRSNVREETSGLGGARRDLIVDAEAQVLIKTNEAGKTYTFGTDGKLTLPNGTKVYDDTGKFYVDALRDDNTATTMVVYNSATKELTRTATFNSTLTINSVIIKGTAASSTNTTASGALQVMGGVGIAGGLYVDQDAYVNADLYVQGTLYVQGNSLDGVDQITGSTGTFATVNSVNINNTGTNPTLANTSTIVPSFKTAGGATIEKDLYVGTTATFATNIYVANDIYLGGKVLSSTSSNFANVTSSGDANLNNVNITGTFTATALTITSTADVDLNYYSRDIDATGQSLGVRGGIKALGNVAVGKVLYAGMNDGGDISGQYPAGKPIDGVFIVNSMQSGGTYDTLGGGSWTHTIDSWDKTRYTSAKYLVQLKDGSKIHTQEMIVIHDGTNVYVTEYGIIYNTGELGTFGGGFNGANVEITFSPNYATSNAFVIQVVRQSIISTVEAYC